MNAQLTPRLRHLRLSGMVDALPGRVAQAEAAPLPHLEFLELLVEDELARRADRLFARRLKQAGITVVNTNFQHNDMRDTGPEKAKDSIQAMLDKFLADTDSAVAPVDTRNAPPKILEPGPVSLYVPVEKPQTLTDKLKKSLSLTKTETKKGPSVTN